MKRRKSMRSAGLAVCILLIVAAICFTIAARYIRAPEIDNSNSNRWDENSLGERLKISGWYRRLSDEHEQGLDKLPEGVAPETVEGNRREGTYTILVIGTSDNYTADTLIVGTIDINRKTMHALSIPRDTKVDAKRSIKKINGSLGRGGVSLVRKEIATIVGFEPDFTVKVDLAGFISLVDAIDGVDFDVPYRMHYDDPTQDLHIHFEPGMQHLDGQKAMELVRYRGHIGSDFSRIEMQQNFLMAVAKKLLTPRNITKVETFAKIYAENVETDLSVGNLIWFGMKAFEIGTDNIKMDTLPTYTKDPDVNPYYYQYVSSAEALKLINETINPYETDITKKNVHHVQFVKPVVETPKPSVSPTPQVQDPNQTDSPPGTENPSDGPQQGEGTENTTPPPSPSTSPVPDPSSETIEPVETTPPEASGTAPIGPNP
ncbi:MAG: LCP family protein [Clostridiales bacterium]|jgi:LCP family protein required for cell wall assembly|nr:LCP family protein [Clostridiales bacterium]